VTLALRVQSQVESETRKIYVLHEGFWILFWGQWVATEGF
jgi:hypothetical protein